MNGRTDGQTVGRMERLTGGRTDEGMDGPTDGRMDGQKDGRTVGPNEEPTDRMTNRPTDRPTDRPSVCFDPETSHNIQKRDSMVPPGAAPRIICPRELGSIDQRPSDVLHQAPPSRRLLLQPLLLLQLRRRQWLLPAVLLSLSIASCDQACRNDRRFRRRRVERAATTMGFLHYDEISTGAIKRGKLRRAAQLSGTTRMPSETGNADRLRSSTVGYYLSTFRSDQSAFAAPKARR